MKPIKNKIYANEIILTKAVKGNKFSTNNNQDFTSKTNKFFKYRKVLTY